MRGAGVGFFVVCLVVGLAFAFRPGFASGSGMMEVPEDVRPLLLTEQEMAPWKVQVQHRTYWAYGEAEGRVLEEIGAGQEWVRDGKRLMWIKMCRFDSDAAAAQAAEYHASHTAEPWYEGCAAAPRLGDKRWSSRPGRGYGVLFQQGPYCILVSSIKGTGEEVNDVIQVATKVSAKVSKSLQLTRPREAEYRRGRYGLTRTSPPALLVKGVDIEELCRTELPTYELWRRRDPGQWGCGVVYAPPSGDSESEVVVAVYRTVADAEEQALEYLNGTSALYEKAGDSLKGIGDSGNCWLHERKDGSSVVFVRRNVLVRVSLYGDAGKQQARDVARAIDQDIIEGRRGVELVETLPPPSIRRVSVPTFLLVGETQPLEVEIIDDTLNGEILLTAVSAGLEVVPSDDAGRILIQGKTPGQHELKVIAVSGLCLVETWRGQVTVGEGGAAAARWEGGAG